MSPASPRAVRFVRALAAGAVAVRGDGTFSAGTTDGNRLTLDRAEVEALQSQGVLDGDRLRVRAGPGARSWLRRAIAEADGFASQHRHLARTEDGISLNLAESPLARLAMPGADGSAPFLARHQVEAGERVRKLAERARLQPRVTMSYDAAHTAGTGGTGSEISDMASDARRALNELARVLPSDCAGVVLDVCGLLKGLQTVETERGWPRRSAKLVLRIGLEHLAVHYGLTAVAVGAPTKRVHSWLGDEARPTVFE